MEESGGQPTVQVKNGDTKKLNEAIAETRNSLETLSQSLSQLKSLN